MDAFVPEVAPPPLLECRDLTKRYGATVALDRFTVSLAAGRIVGPVSYTHLPPAPPAPIASARRCATSATATSTRRSWAVRRSP